MATCQSCGQELLEGTAFCGSCGLATQTTTPGATWGMQAQGIPPVNGSARRNHNSLVLVVIVGVVAVAAIVVGIVIATSGRPSPVTLVNNVASDMNAGDFQGMCNYVLPSQRSSCLSQLSSSSSSQSLRGIKLHMTYRVVKVVVNGNRAIVGFVGRTCISGQCTPIGSSTDPIPGLSRGFNVAFSNALASSSSSSSSSSGAMPCIFQNGKWYADDPTL